MRRLIIVNVNNLSGAPMVARQVAGMLEAEIVCIRQASGTRYESVAHGVKSDRAAAYPLGIVSLLLGGSFWRRFLAADVIILNTALTFPFLLVSRLFRKKTIAVLHECTPKNLLYSVGIALTVRCAQVLVTPSSSAYRQLLGTRANWRVIPNALPVEYFSPTSPRQWARDDEVRVLFAGDERPYKGRDLFLAAKRLLELDQGRRWICHEIGDPGYRALHGASRALTPAVYDSYDFVLVLTDNRLWRETFGIVGSEAASRGCVPLFTDAFAYREIWASIDENLYLEQRTPELVARRLDCLVADPARLQRLRQLLESRARSLCGRESVLQDWKRELEGMGSN
jgi:glycosyltransferase involved in cell wall biosynthesis